jgi:type I restriction enzyme M protein
MGSPVQYPLPYAFARSHELLLEEQDGTLTLWLHGLQSEATSSAVGEVMRKFGVQHVQTEAAELLRQRISAAYAQSESSAATVISEVEADVDLSRMMQALPAIEDLLETSDDAPIIRMLNALLTQAARDGASDIHIEPYERHSSVRFRVDGSLRDVVQPNRALHAALISRLKIMADLDIAEKRLPQDGRISLRIGTRGVDVRVSTLPSAHGERAVLRLLDKSGGKLSLESVGMQGDVLDRFETAGEHYTPREVIRLMVNLLFIEDSKSLSGDKPIRSIYDPACGTGGMLSIAEEHLHEMNPNIVLNVFGQELNDETWAIARSDLMIKGQDPKRITQGNSLTDEDGHTGTYFDYCISNPPYGVDWKKYEKKVKDEAENLGFGGRYGAGLPRVSDGSFLFIQHMISKMKPYDVKKKEGGSRLAIILSGSPLFSGQAASGESEIRRWILENDWLEGIVAMPDQMFYNTGIGTYVWIISNRKDEKSKGKVRLIDARDFGTKVRKSLGDKRKELTDDSIIEITRIYSDAFSAKNDKRVKVMLNEEFGYARLTVERPLRRIWRIDDRAIEIAHALVRDKIKLMNHQTFKNEKHAETELIKLGLVGKELSLALKALATTNQAAEPLVGKKGKIESDPELRDNENIQLPDGFIGLSDDQKLSELRGLAEKHLETEIHPYIKAAWIDHAKTHIGYESPFNRQFYVYASPRAVPDIRKELDDIELQIKNLIEGLS